MIYARSLDAHKVVFYTLKAETGTMLDTFHASVFLHRNQNCAGRSSICLKIKPKVSETRCWIFVILGASKGAEGRRHVSQPPGLC